MIAVEIHERILQQIVEEIDSLPYVPITLLALRREFEDALRERRDRICFES